MNRRLLRGPIPNPSETPGELTVALPKEELLQPLEGTTLKIGDQNYFWTARTLKSPLLDLQAAWSTNDNSYDNHWTTLSISAIEGLIALRSGEYDRATEKFAPKSLPDTEFTEREKLPEKRNLRWHWTMAGATALANADRAEEALVTYREAMEIRGKLLTTNSLRTFKWYLYPDETYRREAEQALREKGLLPNAATN